MSVQEQRTCSARGRTLSPGDAELLLHYCNSQQQQVKLHSTHAMKIKVLPRTIQNRAGQDILQCNAEVTITSTTDQTNTDGD